LGQALPKLHTGISVGETSEKKCTGLQPFCADVPLRNYSTLTAAYRIRVHPYLLCNNEIWTVIEQLSNRLDLFR